MRSWLNGYGASANKANKDYTDNNFLDTAFSDTEQSLILTTDVENKDNLYYETEGGNDTKDKLFLLSESEVYTDAAKLYGFSSNCNTDDEARRSKSSLYAKALGTWSNTGISYVGKCYWWLRSPGLSTDDASDVNGDGGIDRYYLYVSNDYYGVRPALNLNLASSDAISSLCSYAGTVCSDGTMNEVGGSGLSHFTSASTDTDNDITITAYSYGDFTPVAGANVEIAEFGTAVTDSDGAAVIPNTLTDTAMKTEKVSVKKEGYREFYYYKNIYNKDAELLWNSNYESVVLKKLQSGDDTKPYISTMMCQTARGTTYNALLSSGGCYEVSNIAQNVTFRICAVWNGKTPKKYELYQKSGKNYTSTDGIFSLNMGEAFDAGQPVYAKITAADGTESVEETALKISGTSTVSSDGDTFDLLETDSTGTIGSDVALLSGVDLKLDIKKVKCKVSISSDTVKVAIGSKVASMDDDVDDDEKEKFFSNKSWAEWKKLCGETKSFKDLTDTKWKNEIESLKMNYGWGVSGDVSVYGYAEGKKNESGDTVVSGMLKVTVNLNATLGTQYVVGVVPVYAKISIGADSGAEGKFGYNITKNKIDSENTDITLSLEPYLRAEAGVGVEAVANVGVEGSGTLSIESKLAHSENSTIDVTAAMNIKMKLLMFEGSLKIAEKTWNLLPGEKNKKAAKLRQQDFELTQRDSSMVSRWLGSQSRKSVAGRNLKKAVLSGGVERVLETGVYENTEAKLVQAGDTKMLLWLEDDAARDTINGSKLVYSVYDENADSWSEPQAVADDGTADFAPSVVTDGEKIYVAWQNFSKAFSDETSLNEVAKAGTVAMSVWTKQGGFGKAVTVSDTSLMAAAPEIALNGSGKPYVAYIQNTASNLLLTSGQNHIAYSVVDGNNVEKKTYRKNVGLITSLDTVYDKDYCFAYTVDEDGDTSTIADREVVINGISTENEVMDSNPQYAVLSDGVHCFWYQDGKIVEQCADGTKKVIMEDASCAVTDDFLVTAEGKQAAVLWTAADDNGKKQLEGIMYNSAEKAWTKKVMLSDTDASIYNPAGLIDSKGKLELVYKKSGADSTDLCYYQKEKSPDLSVENTYADETKIIAGKTSTVRVEVKNNGDEAADEFTVNVGGTKTKFTQTLAPGESTVVDASYAVPENLSYGKVSVSVKTDGDSNSENDSSYVELGQTELVLNLTDNVYGTSHLVDMQVANESSAATEGTLEVRKDAVDGEVLESLELGRLEKDAVTNVTYQWNQDAAEKYSDAESLYFVVVSKEKERYLGNNSDFICITRKSADSETTPTASPTVSPTSSPTVSPSPSPTVKPTTAPSGSGSSTPSGGGSSTPTATPTVSPTVKPTAAPSGDSSSTPTASPTVKPTSSPTVKPTATPAGDAATPTITPDVTAVPTETPYKDSDSDKISKKLKKGDVVKDKKTKAVYKVIKAGKKRTVEYVKSTKKSAKTVTIPAKVKLSGRYYKVVSIGKKAFYKNKRLQLVTIGKNVTKIGARAFYGCSNLRYVMVKSNKLLAKNVGKDIFAAGYPLPRVKTDEKKWKLYAFIFLSRGMSEKAVFVIDPVELVR